MNGRQRILTALTGGISDRPVRGEIWTGASLDDDDGILSAAIDLDMDFCFFCRAPGLIGAAHGAGLAAGGVVDGPWQRWSARAGWQQAIVALLARPEEAAAGLAIATEEAAAEVAQWGGAGADFVLIADDIAFGGGPYFSPEILTTLFCPLYKRLSADAAAKRMFAGFHADGRTELLLPALGACGFRFFSLEPEATPPPAAWAALEWRAPLFSGLPAAWLHPGAFRSGVEGAVLREWRASGPLVAATCCGLYHPAAHEGLRRIYAWLESEAG